MDKLLAEMLAKFLKEYGRGLDIHLEYTPGYAHVQHDAKNNPIQTSTPPLLKTIKVRIVE